MDEYQNLINIGAGSLLTVLGWFARELWDAVKTLKNELTSLREEIIRDYVRRDDFQDFRKEFRESMQRLFDELKTKQDK